MWAGLRLISFIHYSSSALVFWVLAGACQRHGVGGFYCTILPRKENTQCVLYSDPGQRVLYAFFTRSLRVFYLAQNRGLRQKQVVRCGPPQPPGCGAGLEVWKFAVACVPRATRHGPRALFQTNGDCVCFHGRSAASRPSLATRILPRFLSHSLRVFYSDHRQRVLNAFFFF